jgi:hypothetical protein
MYARVLVYIERLPNFSLIRKSLVFHKTNLYSLISLVAS